MNKNILQKITEQEMDRKDFLKYSGLVLLGVVGLKSIITVLMPAQEKQLTVEPSKNVPHGFGSGKYGV